MDENKKVEEVVDKLWYPNCGHCAAEAGDYYAVEWIASISDLKEMCTKHLHKSVKRIKDNIEKTAKSHVLQALYESKLENAEKELATR